MPTEFMVVGVVPNFQLYGPVTGVQPQVYQSVSQTGFGGRLLVRTAGDPEAFAKAIRDTVHDVDAEIPVGPVETLQSMKLEGLSVPALTAGLLSAFAGTALVITLAGIAGLIGTAVSQRTREFGVRMALGGRPWAIVGSVVKQGLLLVGIGVMAGGVGGYFFSRVIARNLFHTTPTDATAYAAVAGLFLLAGAVAAFVPAKRITSINPLTVLGTD
jgi:ABC-type antimicrobial peptide transport system permease subunit